MSISVTALSRFHLFHMCEQLIKYGHLDQVITAYPKYHLKSKYNELYEYSTCKPFFALERKLVIELKKKGFDEIANKLQETMHRDFSRSVSRSDFNNSNAIVGLSSFMDEVIKSNKNRNKIKIVDHGSLHILTERRILKGECERHGFLPFDNWQHEWMIDRMHSEFNSCDYIFCCSKLAKESMVELGIDENKIHPNPLGVDLTSFKITINTNKGDTFKFLHVSNMNPRKGLVYILDAFENLNVKDAELWLVGSPPKDHKLLGRIYSNSNIKMVGIVPEDELIHLYNQCHVFVHPSLADGWAMTVLQAMACGLPVIVSDMTGSKEVLTDGHDGFIVKSMNSRVLYDQMKFLYDNPSFAENMGIKARESVTNGYTWDDYGKRLNDWVMRFVN